MLFTMEVIFRTHLQFLRVPHCTTPYTRNLSIRTPRHCTETHCTASISPKEEEEQARAEELAVGPWAHVEMRAEVEGPLGDEDGEGPED
jgi:hypothetical protein